MYVLKITFLVLFKFPDFQFTDRTNIIAYALVRILDTLAASIKHVMM